ncbi:hypothetical protein N7541_006910 [Penicillium brevicompactum]|uniref:Uncharacterized protein n=1 Tax=Penicillium brevicompactum TaxID=5074 RepID=A0A9W9R1X2_PENBR|nr:hypothetical protein N7541_006910 [Penicillium brevicompactum]
MLNGARRLRPLRPKSIRNTISRTSAIALSENISQLPAQPLRPSEAQKNDLNLAIAARIAFAGFLQIGEFILSSRPQKSSGLRGYQINPRWYQVLPRHGPRPSYLEEKQERKKPRKC